MPRGVYDRSSAKKKKLQPPAAPKKNGKASKDEIKVMKLSDLELAQMERLSNQIRAADSESLVLLSQKNAYIQSIDKEGKLQAFDGKLRSLQKERQEAENEYRVLSKNIGERLGIDLKLYAYDDRSGVLNKVVDPAPTPVAAKS